MDDNVRNAWISAGKFLQEGNALSSMKLVDSPHYKVRNCKDGLVSICVIWFKTNHSLNLQTYIHLQTYLLIFIYYIDCKVLQCTWQRM